MIASVEQPLRARLAAVRGRIEAACRRAGREAAEVTLVAVTKSVSAEVAACLHAAGVQDLGESRPQELWRKAAAVPPIVRWHLVGHLQRNKVERTLSVATWIHSVDSLRLLEALDQEALRQGRSVDVLLEINASRETAKHGFTPDDVPTLAPQLNKLSHVRVRGLMTMAALEGDPERCRPTFALLRELRDRLAKDLSPPHEMRHLSMGMSNDFEVAVEEGGTMVRLGTVLFKGIAGTSA